MTTNTALLYWKWKDLFCMKWLTLDRLTHLFLMRLFSTPMRTVFWCFQGVEKGRIGNKWVNKGQVNVFVKCLKLVRMYTIFLEKQTIGCKKQRFQNLWGLKSTNRKASKVELLFNYTKSIRLENLNIRFF